jgi:hypothetical protein
MDACRYDRRLLQFAGGSHVLRNTRSVRRVRRMSRVAQCLKAYRVRQKGVARVVSRTSVSVTEDGDVQQIVDAQTLTSSRRPRVSIWE